MDKLPDSTWEFVKEAEKKLIEKGNGKTALINDFSLTTQSGTDTTAALLSTPGEYYLLFVKDNKIGKEALKASKDFIDKFNYQKKLFIVTAQPNEITTLFKNLKQWQQCLILICDGVAIKTAARSTPTLYKMNGPVVETKYGWSDLRKANQLGGFASMIKTFK
jgi:ABC-type glycerol-3-phosphate transport system substrate-binding protein